MPARFGEYEVTNTVPHTSCSFVRERKNKTPCIIGAGIEIRHRGAQESHLTQPLNTRENLPEEGSGLGNIVPATLSA